MLNSPDQRVWCVVSWHVIVVLEGEVEQLVAHDPDSRERLDVG